MLTTATKIQQLPPSLCMLKSLSCPWKSSVKRGDKVGHGKSIWHGGLLVPFLVDLVEKGKDTSKIFRNIAIFQKRVMMQHQCLENPLK